MVNTQAIVGSTIIDGTGSEPIAKGTILIRDGKIVDVGSYENVVVPPDASMIDATGKLQCRELSMHTFT